MKIFDKALLGFILLVAIALRFYNFADIPFTHDEFSVWSRLHYVSLGELIEKGVMIHDTHPAGVQVFVYFWSLLFGETPWVIKLPFAIAGVLSVYIVFEIGRIWFSKTTGFISAAYLASLQFAIMYSQIARPYISGMFFSLLLVLFWSKLIKSPEKNRVRNSIGFVLAATLCAYNHHFSFLFAIIVGFSGFLFLEKKYFLRYAALGLAVAILYLPHLEIFLYQLNRGGVGEWLAKPEPDFILDYFKYIFHFSSFVIILCLGILAVGVWKKDIKKGTLKGMLLFAAWFLLPFLIGYFYSINFAPVLQYSVLIFSFPFLFFVLFGLFKPLSNYQNALLVITIVGVNVFTLIKDRQHYSVFYTSVYEQILTDRELVNNDQKNLVSLIGSNRLISNYYIEKDNIDTNFIWLDTFADGPELIQFLESSEAEFLYLGAEAHFPFESAAIVKSYFPTLEWQHNYFLGSTYLFSKKKSPKKNNNYSLFSEEKGSGIAWTLVDSTKLAIDSLSQESFYHITPDVEWSPFFVCHLNDIRKQVNDGIDITLTVKMLGNTDDVILVAALEKEGEVKFWGSVPIDKFTIDSIGRTTLYHSLNLAGQKERAENLELKVFIWNRSKSQFNIEQFEVRQRDGNPFYYGLYDPILN